MIVRDDNGDYVGIMCDAVDCVTMAPSVREIQAAHGLTRLGWDVRHGQQLCPEHVNARTIDA